MPFEKGHKINKGRIRKPFTPETRKRMSEAQKKVIRKPLTKEHIDNLIKARKKWSYTEEQKENIRQGILKSYANGRKPAKSCFPVGKTHPNWKGGVTPEDKKLRNSKRYQQWRNKIFIRDDYTCQECGVIGTELNAHHIKMWSEHEQLRFEIKNGITLCIECHKKIHSKSI